ncbi:MAG: hypothetical protein IKO36_01530 [Bacteroidaceae bacterium]|nr:hypothetical protein [Bacteroidaceae bacterium]
MNNPIFNAMMKNSSLGGMQNLVQQYQQFRNTFQGDPQQKIQEMLNSGQITQAQVNQARSMATEFQKFMR